jgi:hypothetical protein
MVETRRATAGAPLQAKETPTLAVGASLCFRVLVLRSANVIQFITT